MCSSSALPLDRAPSPGSREVRQVYSTLSMKYWEQWLKLEPSLLLQPGFPAAVLLSFCLSTLLTSANNRVPAEGPVGVSTH